MDGFVEIMAAIEAVAIVSYLVAVPVAVAMAHDRIDSLNRRVTDLESRKS